MTWMHSFLKRLRHMGGDASGAATVEFVLVFPFFIAIFLSAFDMAAMNIRAVSLERATDQVVRSIRLGGGSTVAYDKVLSDVCNRVFMIDDCKNSVKIELQKVATNSWTLPSPDADCSKRDGTIRPARGFANGAENELMLVRVCAIVDPFFPNIGVGRSMPKTDDGGYWVIASSAFVNEPD